MHERDVIVIGGGTAGSAAARAAHEAGARTTMFLDGEPGGLCILRGCMPTKTLLHSAALVHEAETHHTPGIGHAELAIDFAAVMANKDAKVRRFQKAKIASIEAGGYEVVRARARFSGPDTIEANGETWRFRRGAIVATGSVPHIPEIPGIDSVDFWTSDDVMRITELPASLLVVGAGAVGLELAQFFARMRCPVTLVNRRPPLWRHGAAVHEEMRRVLADEPRLESHAPVHMLEVEQTTDGVAMLVESEEAGEYTLCAERLLVATGRLPAVEDLDLGAAGVTVAEGRVVRGEDLRTTNPAVFVVGDAAGQEMLLHVANLEGRLAGRNAALREAATRDWPCFEVIFTDPSFARVGLTPQDAGGAGRPLVAASARFPETGRAITMDVRHGLWEMFADADTGEIVGSRILGPRADDLAHVVAVALRTHAAAEDLVDLPWYHPTLAEVALDLVRALAARVRSGAARPATGVRARQD